MKVVDANVLIYAVNDELPHHAASRRWLDTSLAGHDTVGFTWLVLLAFVRLTTKRGLFPEPLSVEDAVDQAETWLAAPGAQLLEPDRGHLGAIARLTSPTVASGDLINDAHLAALAIQHRAAIVSYDSDFGRFPGVTSHRPDDLLAP